VYPKGDLFRTLSFPIFNGKIGLLVLPPQDLGLKFCILRENFYALVCQDFDRKIIQFILTAISIFAPQYFGLSKIYFR